MGGYNFEIDDALVQRFLAKVRKTDGCWLWIGCGPATGNQRYGQILCGSRKNKRTVMRAHRLSWLIYRGDIPDGLYVCHSCDNGACVKPKHLFLGTQQDNMDDMKKKGRGFGLVGEANHKAKLSIEDVKRLLFLYQKYSHLYGIGPKLAKKFRITRQQVWAIVKGRAWGKALGAGNQ